MAVTDLTDSLPYWARQGGSGPPAAPPGVDQTQWLHYLMAMNNVPQSNPADTPSPDATPMEADAPPSDDHGTGPPPPPPPVMRNFGNPPPPVNPPGPGGVAPVPLTPPPGPLAASVQQPPQARPGPPVGAGMLDQSGVVRMGGPSGVLNTQLPTGASAPVGAGLPDQSGITRNAAGVLTPGVAAAPAPAPAPAAPAGRDITVHPRPVVPGPMAPNNRFIGIDAPNASPQNSMRAGPQGTALNLAGLFGGGQPAAAPAAAQNVPLGQTPMPPPRPVPGPLAGPPGRMQMTPDQLASAVKKPNWWQGLGRPDMTPDQLASAVKKPGWYRNV